VTEWNWLGEATVLAIHDVQLTEHRGAPGVRDHGLLDSALARPRNLAAYDDPDAFAVAASYAFGIVRNHPFVDGNKRTAFVVAATFLLDNGYELDASEPDATIAMLRLAEGTMSEAAFAAWLRQNSDAVRPPRPTRSPGRARKRGGGRRGPRRP
jgi:death on curing protein